ncbi:MAG: NRDE family protein [Sutterellaceae bacterium]|nr:NRDE family protein [Burkholderiaceae bacterium]MCX7902411.1 NRDE family protein [Burkholderiaceae bacterium]MDW8431034.1 NRDE family protein [Sutterellaceae bacterium]
MCLAVIAWHCHPDYPLVVVANRDEFYARRARPAAWWGQSVALLGGRDEEAGGAWFAVNRRGRFAMITNVRAPTERNPHAPSRGSLVVACLQAREPVGVWMHNTRERARQFNGFNLVAGDALALRDCGWLPELFYYTNRLDDPPRRLAPGIYGLSNAFLDTPWPKVTRTVARFACQLAQRVDIDAFLQMMADRTVARDRELPATGVPLEWERALSAVMIRANGYGTRATTVLTVRADGLVTFVERSFDTEDPQRHTDRRFEFMVDCVHVTGR